MNEAVIANEETRNIAFREAEEIACWQQVRAFADALVPAAQRYLEIAGYRPSGQDPFDDVKDLLLRATAAVLFGTTIEKVTEEQLFSAFDPCH